MTKKTLLETVREYDLFEVKEVISATKVQRATLQNWVESRPELLRLILIGMQADKKAK
jgi:hypothetical protein